MSAVLVLGTKRWVGLTDQLWLSQINELQVQGEWGRETEKERERERVSKIW